MSAQLVLGVVGGVVGFVYGGGTGAQIGWAVGSAVGSAVDGPTRVKGPMLSDLKAPRASYGTVIPRIYGMPPRMTGLPVWMSDKRPIENTQSSGKGGGGAVANTTYTYDMDVMFMLSSNPLAGLRRVWVNNELVWSVAETASDASLKNSSQTAHWNALRFYGGGPAQLPDPLLEAALGMGNTPAYRGRACVMIEALHCGTSGQIPQIEFEVFQLGVGGYVGSMDTFEWGTDGDGAGSITSITPGNPGLRSLPQTSLLGDVIADICATSGVLPSQIYIEPGLYPQPVRGFASSATSSARALLEGLAEAYSFDMVESQGKVKFIGRAFEEGWVDYDPWDAGRAITRLRAKGNLLPAAEADPDLQWRIGATGFKFHGTEGLTGVHADIAPGTNGFTNPPNPYRQGTPWKRQTTTTVIATEYRVVGQAHSVFNSGALTPALVYDSGWLTEIPLKAAVMDWYSQWEGVNTASPPSMIGTSAQWALNGYEERILRVVGVRLVPGGFSSVLGIWPAFEGEMHYEVQPYLLSDGIAARGVAFSDSYWATQERTGPVTTVVDEALTDDGAALEFGQLFYNWKHGLAGAGPTEYAQWLDIVAKIFGAGDQVAILAASSPLDVPPRLPAAVIPYADLGAGEGTAEEALPFVLANGDELPSSVVVSYANVLADYEVATATIPRLEGAPHATEAVSTPLALTPTEAIRIAEVRAKSITASMLRAEGVAVDMRYAALEPTDIVEVVDLDGRVYRCRIGKITESGPVRKLDLAVDDAAAYVGTATGATTVTGTDGVRGLSPTVLSVLDIPILRDSDDNAGLYLAATPLSPADQWPGAAVFQGVNGSGFARILDLMTRVPFVGTQVVDLAQATAMLPYEGGGFDTASVLTVRGSGTLENWDRASILEGRATPLLVGKEILYYQTAELATESGGTKTYRLRNLLRGQKSTRWTLRHGSDAAEGINSHGVRVVALGSSLGRHLLQGAQIGVTLDYRGVTMTQTLDSAATITAVCRDEARRPAPVGRIVLKGSTVTWERTSRYATRLAGASGILVPLDFASEAYALETVDSTGAVVSTHSVTGVRTLTLMSLPYDLRIMQVAPSGLMSHPTYLSDWT